MTHLSLILHRDSVETIDDEHLDRASIALQAQAELSGQSPFQVLVLFKLDFELVSALQAGLVHDDEWLQPCKSGGEIGGAPEFPQLIDPPFPGDFHPGIPFCRLDVDFAKLR